MSATQHSVRDHSPGVHVTASIAIRDDTIASDGGFVGLAIKQKGGTIDTPRADLDLIKVGEGYYLWDSGEADVVVPGGLSVAKGTKLWIDPATQTLYTATGTGRLKVGMVRYIGPERGLATNMMTVGFDARKDF